jgi:hypothetical protein
LLLPTGLASARKPAFLSRLLDTASVGHAAALIGPIAAPVDGAASVDLNADAIGALLCFRVLSESGSSPEHEPHNE